MYLRIMENIKIYTESFVWKVKKLCRRTDVGEAFVRSEGSIN